MVENHVFKDAILYARRLAGPSWKPGQCADCEVPLPGWNEIRNWTVKFLCADCERRRGEERKRREAEEEQARHSAMFESVWARIPRAFRDLRPNTVAARTKRPAAIEEARQALVAALGGGPPLVTLVGPTGVGKTSLAAAIVAEHVEAGMPVGAGRKRFARGFGVRFYLSADLARARERSPLGDEARDVADALAATILVIDELGGENPRHIETIEEVIHRRHADILPTVITTGLSGAQLSGRYSGGISRRIASDPKSGVIVHCAEMAAAPPRPVRLTDGGKGGGRTGRAGSA
jgi:DNA replication protein DnaC